MSITPTNPVAGAAITGLTSPTFTLSSPSNLPDANAKQYTVTALGGTQTGVAVHSTSSAFRAIFWVPRIIKAIKAVVGVLTLQKVEYNTYAMVVDKGVTPFAGQPPANMKVSIKFEVPAGAETNDSNSVAACISLAGGLLSAEASDILAMIKSGQS